MISLFGGVNVNMIFLAGPATPAGLSSILNYGFIIVPLLLLYFFMLRPQKKKEKAINNMRSNLKVGDEITTIGGIIGKVVMIKDDDQLVIESGVDKTKIRIAKWAIQTVNTISEK